MYCCYTPTIELYRLLPFTLSSAQVLNADWVHREENSEVATSKSKNLPRAHVLQWAPMPSLHPAASGAPSGQTASTTAYSFLPQAAAAPPFRCSSGSTAWEEAAWSAVTPGEGAMSPCLACPPQGPAWRLVPTCATIYLTRHIAGVPFYSSQVAPDHAGGTALPDHAARSAWLGRSRPTNRRLVASPSHRLQPCHITPSLQNDHLPRP